MDQGNTNRQRMYSAALCSTAEGRCIIQELSKRMKERNLVNADFQEAVLNGNRSIPTGLLIGKRNIAIPWRPQYVKSTVYRYRHLEKSVAFHRMDACDELVDGCRTAACLEVRHAHVEMLKQNHPHVPGMKHSSRN